MRRNHSKAGHKCYSIGSYWQATLSWLWLIKELATHSRMSKAIKCERKTILWHKMSQACLSYVETVIQVIRIFCCISAVAILFLQKEKIFNTYFSVHFETIAYKGNAIDFLLTFSCDLRKTIGRDNTPKSQKRHHQIFHWQTKRYRELLLLVVDLHFTS